MEDAQNKMDQWLNNQISQFDYQVQPDDWKDFEEKYFEKKSKKRFIWWWTLPLFGICLMLYIYIPQKINSSKNTSQKQNLNNHFILAKDTKSNTSTYTGKQTLQLKEKPNKMKQLYLPPQENTTETTLPLFAKNSTNKITNNLESSSDTKQMESNTVNTESKKKLENLVNESSIGKQPDTTQKHFTNQPEPRKKFKNKENSLPPFFIGLAENITLYQQLGNTSNNIQIKPSQQVSPQITFEIGAYIKPYFSVSTGMGIFNYSYQTTFDENLTIYTKKTNQFTNLKLDVNTGKINKISYTVHTIDSIQETKTHQGKINTQYIYIPVKIEYHLPMRKFEAQLSGGYQLMYKTSTQLTGELPQNTTFSNTNLNAWTIGADIRYKPNKKLVFRGGWNQWFFNTAKNNTLYTPKQIGNISLGIQYIFNQKKQ